MLDSQGGGRGAGTGVFRVHRGAHTPTPPPVGGNHGRERRRSRARAFIGELPSTTFESSPLTTLTRRLRIESYAIVRMQSPIYDTSMLSSTTPGSGGGPAGPADPGGSGGTGDPGDAGDPGHVCT